MREEEAHIVLANFVGDRLTNDVEERDRFDHHGSVGPPTSEADQDTASSSTEGQEKKLT